MSLMASTFFVNINSRRKGQIPQLHSHRADNLRQRGYSHPHRFECVYRDAIFPVHQSRAFVHPRVFHYPHQAVGEFARYSPHEGDRRRSLPGWVENVGTLLVRSPVARLLGLLQAQFFLLDLATGMYLLTVNSFVSGSFIILAFSIVVAYVYFTLGRSIDSRLPYQTPMSFTLRWFGRVFFSHPVASLDGLIRVVTHFLSHPITSLKRMHIIPHTSNQGPDELDVHCVSWTLQISVDRAVRLSTLEHLATMGTLAGIAPVLVANCFHVFVDCVNVLDNDVVVVREHGRLATASAMSFFRIFRSRIRSLGCSSTFVGAVP